MCCFVGVADQLYDAPSALHLLHVAYDVLQLALAVLQSAVVEVVPLGLKVHHYCSILVRKDELQYLLLRQLLKEFLYDYIRFGVFGIVPPNLKVDVEDAIKRILVRKVK